MNAKFSELTLPEKFLFLGHTLNSISMALISIGAILRKNQLPDFPSFHSSNQENAGFQNTKNSSSNYWER